VGEMPTQRSPVRPMVEATRPGLLGLSSLSLNLRGLGLQQGHALLQLLNQPGVVLLLLLLLISYDPMTVYRP
jgi:hypothetical protein